MRKQLKIELEEFRKFKRNYNFFQKDIIKIDDAFYCDDELVQQGEEVTYGESSKWINVGYKIKGAFPKVLSNLFRYEFEFRGEKLSSIESFFQGLKFKDKEAQKLIFSYSGLDANNIKLASDYNWQECQTLYWRGVPIKRDSLEYDELVEELYLSAIQNPLYRNVLKAVDRPIIHSIGETDKEKTVFTRYEFEFMLNCLVAFLKDRK